MKVVVLKNVMKETVIANTKTSIVIGKVASNQAITIKPRSRTADCVSNRYVLRKSYAHIFNDSILGTAY